MSRTTLALLLCASTSVVAADDEVLLPVPDPISTATVDPCSEEWDEYQTALATYNAAGELYVDSLADLSLAQNALSSCLAGGGTCSSEQAAVTLAEQLVDAASDALSDASADVTEAEALYDECMCGSGGPEPEPGPEPPEPPVAVLGKQGFYTLALALGAT